MEMNINYDGVKVWHSYRSPVSVREAKLLYDNFHLRLSGGDYELDKSVSYRSRHEDRFHRADLFMCVPGVMPRRGTEEHYLPFYELVNEEDTLSLFGITVAQSLARKFGVERKNCAIFPCYFSEDSRDALTLKFVYGLDGECPTHLLFYSTNKIAVAGSRWYNLPCIRTMINKKEVYAVPIALKEIEKIIPRSREEIILSIAESSRLVEETEYALYSGKSTN